MDIRSLRQVVAIRQHGSFAKAAEALGIAQPTLSKSISRLEDQLKVRIFDRSAAGSELTPIGELIVERAERVLGEVRDLVRDASLVAGGESGLVRLGVGSPLRSSFLPKLLLRIVRHHPRLRLRIEVGASDRLLPLLQSRELDMVLCAHSPAFGSGAFVFQEVITAGALAVVSPEHPLAGKRGIEPSSLGDFRCAGPDVAGFRVSELLGLGADNENAEAFTANDFDALLPLARAGHAVLLAPSFLVREEIAAGALVPLDIDWNIEVPYGAAMMRAGSFSPVLRKIARYACEVGEELRGDWRGTAGARRGR